MLSFLSELEQLNNHMKVYIARLLPWERDLYLKPRVFSSSVLQYLSHWMTGFSCLFSVKLPWEWRSLCSFPLMNLNYWLVSLNLWKLLLVSAVLGLTALGLAKRVTSNLTDIFSEGNNVKIDKRNSVFNKYSFLCTLLSSYVLLQTSLKF